MKVKMKLLYSLTVVTFLILAVACGGNQKTESVSNDSLETAKNETSVSKTIWSYSEDEDKMTNNKRYFASCVSSNKIEFDFPYKGGSSFTLTVRNLGEGNEVTLKVSKGQFTTSVMSQESIKVKFDDEQPMTFSYNSAADGSADIIFLANSDKFISKLKKAKKIIIEAQFYQAGNKIVEFNDVAGLIWDKK